MKFIQVFRQIPVPNGNIISLFGLKETNALNL